MPRRPIVSWHRKSRARSDHGWTSVGRSRVLSLWLRRASPPDGESVFSWIGTAHHHAGSGIDQDALESAEDADTADDPMAARVEAEARLRRNRRFEREPVRRMPESRCLARLLDVHAEVDQVQEHLHVPLRLHVAAHDAKRQPRTSVLHDHRRHERMKWPLAGCEEVWMASTKREQRAAVVQRDAGVAGNDPGAETFVNGLDERDDVAVLVGGGEVDRVTVRLRMLFAGGRGAIDGERLVLTPGTFGVDFLPSRRGVFLREHSPQRRRLASRPDRRARRRGRRRRSSWLRPEGAGTQQCYGPAP